MIAVAHLLKPLQTLLCSACVLALPGEVAVYVRNLGNQDYITGTANVPIPAITGRPGNPQQWGTQFTRRP